MMMMFPAMYKDELLYSAIARYSVRCCHTNNINVLQDLYGNPNDVIATVEVPTRLKRFLTNLPVGNALTMDYIFDQHTMLPFFMAFRDKEDMDELKVCCSSGNGSVAYNKTGLSGHRVRMNKHLMYCPICAAKSIEEHGEGYWNRIHNIPGILVCPYHKIPLISGPMFKQGNRQRFIPFSHDLLQRQVTMEFSGRVIKHACDIASIINEIFEIDIPFHSADWYTDQIRLYLVERGFSNMTGFVKQKQLTEGIFEYYGEEYLELIGCEIGHSDANWVSDICRQNGKHAHPLKFILIFNFLGCDAKGIFTEYATKDGCSSLEDYQNLWDDRLTDLVKLDMSLRQICKLLQSSKQTVLRGIKRLELVYDPQKKYNGGGRHVDGDYGETKEFERRLKENRNTWMSILAEHPSESAGEHKERNPIVHRWLMKYDHDWLRENTTNVSKVGRTFNWKERDEQLLKSVQEVVMQMEDGMPERITYGIVASQLGIQGWFSKKIDLLPKTKAFLDMHTTTVEEFHLKRLKWAVEYMICNNITLSRNKLAETSKVSRKYVTEELYREVIREL